MTHQLKKLLFCCMAIQIILITPSILHAATCSNNWLRPSSQTMETEVMSASMTEYANGEHYFSFKQGGKEFDVYYLKGAVLVKGLDDSEINYDHIFWLPTVFMQKGVLLQAFPQGPCSVKQKTTFSLPDATGEITPVAPGVFDYQYSLEKSISSDKDIRNFKGTMKFTQPLAAPFEDSNISGYKLVKREKPYQVIGSKDMPAITIRELRRELYEIHNGTKKWTGPIPEIVMTPAEKKDNHTKKEIYPFHIGGERGLVRFIDKKGQVIVETPCILVGDFYEDIAICTDKYFKRSFINKEGKVIFGSNQGEIEDHARFSEGLAAVKKDGKFGFIDKNGTFVIEPQFSIRGTNQIPSFSEGLAPMQKDMKWGFIDKKGNFVIEPQFERVCDFHEGLAAVSKDRKKWGFINKQGVFVIQPQFDYTPDSPIFSEGLAALKKNEKWGSINKKGEFVIEPQFDFHYKFYDGFASVCKNGVYSFIDKTGKYATEEYTPAYYFHDGLSVKEKDGKKGYIDKTGKFFIEPQFDIAGPFKNGVAHVRKNDKLGLIDKSGKIFVFKDKVCGHEVLKNHKGEITWPQNIKELCRQ